MHNADVERLFDNLPKGVRIPVEINYTPVIERVDPLTFERYLEVYYDIYKRVTDWPGLLQQSAARLGFEAPGWMSVPTSRPFTDSMIMAANPVIRNNNSLLTVGARILDGEYYIPRSVAELMLGEKLEDEVALVFSQEPYLEYVWAGNIEARTGRGFYYDPMHNALYFSTTRLISKSEFAGYHKVFVHPDFGPMVSAVDLHALTGLNGGPGILLGPSIYYTSEQLRELGLSSAWDPRSGELSLFPLAITVEP